MQSQNSSTTFIVLLNLQAFGPLVYAVPSLIVYIVLIAVLLGQFKEPFYRLFAINGILECLVWTFHFFTSRACHCPFFYPLYSVIPPSGVFMDVVYFFFCYARFVLFFSTFSLSFNRFSVLFFHTNYAEKWRRLLPFFCVAIFILPALLAADAARYGAELVLLDLGYYVQPKSEAAETRLTVANAVVAFATTASCGFMEATSGIYIFIRRRKSRGSMKGTRHIEMQLYLMSLKLFIGGLMILCIVVIFYVLHLQGEISPMRTLILADIHLLVFDFHMFTNPWLLIAMSRHVRNALMELLCNNPVKTVNGRVFSVRTATQ